MQYIISNKLRRYNNLYSEITAVYHDISVKLGISDSATLILYNICCEGGSLPLGELCRCSGLSKQTIHSSIRKLEQEGVVHLEAIDGKSKRVCLTEQGKRYTEKTILRMMQMEESVYSSWEEADLEKYLELTERFLHSLKEKAGQMT